MYKTLMSRNACNCTCTLMLITPNWRISGPMKQNYCTYNELNRIGIPSGRKETSWLCTRAGDELNKTGLQIMSGWRRSNCPVKPIFAWTYPIFGRPNNDNKNIEPSNMQLKLDTLNFVPTSVNDRTNCLAIYGFDWSKPIFDRTFSVDRPLFATMQGYLG